MKDKKISDEDKLEDQRSQYRKKKKKRHIRASKNTVTGTEKVNRAHLPFHTMKGLERTQCND